MTKEEATTLAHSLLATSHNVEWAVKWSKAAPSECWHRSKTLMLWEGELDKPWWYVKEVVIHEIAHIDQDPNEYKDCSGHGPAFFTRYGQLLILLAHVR